MSEEFVDNDEKIMVATNMINFGGGFVRLLAKALLHADPVNTRKIKNAFPEYWEEYRLWRTTTNE